jgi:hypothetical protein
MKHFVGISVAVAGVLLTFGGARAQAQVMPQRPGFGQTNTPVYSPYLNLFRNGSFTQNYWGLVRPEFEFRGAVQGLQQQAATSDQAINGLEVASTLPTTGHPSRFLSTGRYFLNSGGQVGAGRGSVAGPGMGSRAIANPGQGAAMPSTIPGR